jgi:hypothetical protein
MDTAYAQIFSPQTPPLPEDVEATEGKRIGCATTIRSRRKAQG